ncbi:hypothetical protein Poly30_17890 [Planctomycetes bacterium Poly30]|uniref:FG-GAP repeat protein n=1 Tax=Saltatorellus ferox TaxID=2528018 RepID=A0A518EQC1_9BACT|nr:hypothetical protein Poly30_17890 [Planctomycetes bacterium Poly30]
MLERFPSTRALAAPWLALAGFASPALALSPAPQSQALFQDAYVKASNTDPADYFGYSIAVFGDRVVVGARDEDSAATGVNGDQFSNAAPNSGAVYVYRLVAGQWTQEAYLKASNAEAGDRFGAAVALGGDILVVGAPGEASGGSSPFLNNAPGAGAVYVFRFIDGGSGGEWVQTHYLKPSNPGAQDEFGTALDLDGPRLIVGAEGEDSGDPLNPLDDTSIDAGAAYIFLETSSQNWIQSAYLKSPSPDSGDNFGVSVGVGATPSPGVFRAVVGARYEDSNATGIGGDFSNNSAANAGAAYVFQENASTWQFDTYLKGSNTGTGDSFGYSVTIDRDRILVGAPFEDSSVGGVNPSQSDNVLNSAGAVYSFRLGSGGWTEDAYVKASNPGASDYFGVSVALAGTHMVVGASREASTSTAIDGDQTSNGAGGSGASYLFSNRLTPNWVQDAYIKASNAQANDYFSIPAALTDRWLVVGAVREDGSGSGIGANQFSNGSSESGAAYFFRLGDGPFLNYCLPTINSTFQPGRMSGTGSGLVIANDVVLTASALPANAFGFFIVGRDRAYVIQPGGSSGNLCIGGGALGRYVGPGQVQNAGPGGTISLAINSAAIPSAVGFLAALPGDEFHFQAWYRDSVGGTPVSNFTDGLTVLFR